MKVLVACEESQRVCIAFRQKGHEAYSCDLQACSGGHPEWHINDNVLKVNNGNCHFTTQDGVMHEIKGEWDLIIAHPPCTYLTIVGSQHLWLSENIRNEKRWAEMQQGAKFFMRLYNSMCKKICVENPLPVSYAKLPPYTQIINPWEHGEPFSKRTCLWLKNLPLLTPTKIIPKDKRITCMDSKWFNQGQWKNGERARLRSKTFIGIANAMAEQWG